MRCRWPRERWELRKAAAEPSQLCAGVLGLSRLCAAARVSAGDGHEGKGMALLPEASGAGSDAGDAVMLQPLSSTAEPRVAAPCQGDRAGHGVPQRDVLGVWQLCLWQHRLPAKPLSVDGGKCAISWFGSSEFS